MGEDEPTHFDYAHIFQRGLELNHQLPKKVACPQKGNPKGLKFVKSSLQEIIAVNQAWAGHSGSPFKQAKSYVELDDFNMQLKGVVIPHESQAGQLGNL